ncbi:glucose-6-phosphate isomerase [Candidatus Saccharibacteria bacterium]|nr:glucose-6-phosphate isomerase [Candidatus Saccharibacteria bacterium]
MIRVNYPDTKVDTEKARDILAKISENPMGGWLNLPKNYDREEFARVKEAAKRINETSKYLVCIGIGGSYLGHRALIEALKPSSSTKILYAGNSLSSNSLKEVLNELGDADFSINVISKSGTTTEPAIAFRIFKEKLIEKYGEEEASRRIFATTDANKGALHDEAVKKGYTRFVVPDSIGGRYSVFTAVGLLPLAVAGVNIDDLLAGAAEFTSDLDNPENSNILRYAFTRHDIREKGHDVEVLSSFEPSFAYFNEWWKQLFGESEGKDGKGIFPASVICTTDLHSMGQYLQEGRRNIFETVIKVLSNEIDFVVPKTPDDCDGLGYLEGKSLNHINEQALEATVSAHKRGNIPVIKIEMPDISAKSFGALIYFFETACAVSAMLGGVNPFDQPGVEEYKNEMFKLLGKTGF